MAVGGHTVSLSGASSNAMLNHAQPPVAPAAFAQSPTSSDASRKPKPACLQCYDARKKCTGSIPCELCVRKGLQCCARVKTNSSNAAAATSYPQYGASSAGPSKK
ncbi:hypothetical protein L226DRAFT_537478 [Lentinus tigrinus ALCF2SS1-7]|uniref:Zn(2)-C6 fungal-type domain-containing protein n=1 Tax=Lentinus tigrinus ALCF2SS1-6 TaxID=1328759 RepID=A0A5C2S1W7_9APHY|nr:hypothetical protein L227DRAFT_229775 [Lentinus tigrinus ALCF2SS1-6]RPD72050.1 hypothetical protein L226DRAFT_537478 [Lentinus tigrinus ALCF2SS1-7]